MTQNQTGTVIFEGPDQIKVYNAIVLKHALTLYHKTGMKVNRSYTPGNMLKAATLITGKKYKRGQYLPAIIDLEEWLQSTRQPTQES